LNSVVFRKHADATAGRKFLSLFPGLGYAAGYKILQRVYKYVEGIAYFKVSSDLLQFCAGSVDSHTQTTSSSMWTPPS